MLVVISVPYVIKRSVRDEMTQKYTEMLRSGDCVLVDDPYSRVTVYKTDSEDISVKIVDTFVDSTDTYMPTEKEIGETHRAIMQIEAKKGGQE